MATTQDERPRYYEDQYLGADDLDQAVLYGQVQQARHALGAHTWGISIGLDLVERPRPGNGNRVDVFVTPGYAWDGYGRPIVVLTPAPVPESLFADIRFDPQNASDRDGKGRLITVWLQYDQQTLRSPLQGFESCSQGDKNSRIRESFRFLVGDFKSADRHAPVVINSAEVDPKDALNRFDALSNSSPSSNAPARPLFDESVPHQEYPSGETAKLWLVPIGAVRWLPAQNGPGHFVKRDDSATLPDSDEIRKKRRYAGVVAESIEGAGGVIRLRNRFTDPDGVGFRPPLITTDPQKPPENEVVWVEGDLRVVGDTRLAGGKLAFRIGDGTDEGTPLEILRTVFPQAGPGSRTLQVILGSNTQETNRLAIGRAVPDQPFDQKFVVTSAGNVGIGTDTPSGTLTIKSSFDTLLEITPTSSSLPWQSDGTVNEGAFVINHKSIGSQKPDADFALMRDRKQRVILGDTDTFISSQDRGGAKGQLRFFLNRAEAGEKEVLRINSLGKVGIGALDPQGKLTVEAPEHINVILDRTDTGDHMTLTVGSQGTGIHFSDSNRFFISADSYLNRDTKGSGNELFTILSSGEVGIGTAAPSSLLHVNGDAAKPGGGSWTTTSDERLKKNIEPLTGALNRLTTLRGVTFEWKNPESQGGQRGKQIGMIGQEVENVFPEWVSADAKGYKDLTFRGFEALTVEALKELQREIDALKLATNEKRADKRTSRSQAGAES